MPNDVPYYVDSKPFIDLMDMLDNEIHNLETKTRKGIDEGEDEIRRDAMYQFKCALELTLGLASYTH